MANTPNIDLVKPAGTDHALVSVLNSNSDKIDTFAGTTNQAIANLAEYESIGSVASQSALETALETKLATMTNGTNVSISVTISTAFGSFAKTTYYAKLSRVIGNYATALFEECNITDNKLLIKATKSSGTWYFEELAFKSDISSICKVGSLQYLTTSNPVSVTPVTTLSIVCGQYGSNGFMYMIFRASSTNASACPIKTDSNITVTSSNGVITFSNSSGNSYRVQVISLSA